MTEFCIQLLYDHIDLSDEESLRVLGEAGVVAAEPEGEQTRITAALESTNAVKAAASFVSTLREVLPSAVPLMASRDLVNITDIADRVGVSREAVRNWASGRRRTGVFPLPLDTPGGQKVWEWAAVHAWLRHNLQLWDGLAFPSHAEFGSIDALIDHVIRTDGCTIKPAARNWMVVESTARTSSSTVAASLRPSRVSRHPWERVAAQ
ncbi:MAG TPA: hypothetical protein PKE05_02225 [Microthrixaceae bacterium]|jgi:hypothetical protein|nr:hypothetical protein [Microthrixaceae bacterium]HMT26420.1 hypothetical protein [Microthrixaceae bacterium]HMT62367.1 hypothetical protein [Microthrixaceae bacterium]